VGDPSEGANTVRPRRAAGLTPLADGDDAEAGAGVEAVAHHLLVALLEDVQRHRHMGKQHGAQQEQGKRSGHAEF
jgi:hypothetical protein